MEQSPSFEGPSTMGDVSPRSFGEIPPLWLRFLQMGETFFAREAPRASGSNTLIGVLILSAISAILSWVSLQIGPAVPSSMIPPEYRDFMTPMMEPNPLVSLCSGFLGGVLGFYLSAGLVYLGARVFGGSGDFTPQAYLVSLFAVPLGVLSGVLGLIPCAGPLISLGLSIYGIVLNVQVVKVVHNLTTGRAVAAVLVPAILIGLAVGCLVAGILVLLAPAIGNIFQSLPGGM